MHQILFLPACDLDKDSKNSDVIYFSAIKLFIYHTAFESLIVVDCFVLCNEFPWFTLLGHLINVLLWMHAARVS